MKTLMFALISSISLLTVACGGASESEATDEVDGSVAIANIASPPTVLCEGSIDATNGDGTVFIRELYGMPASGIKRLAKGIYSITLPGKPPDGSFITFLNNVRIGGLVADGGYVPLTGSQIVLGTNVNQQVADVAFAFRVDLIPVF